MTLPTEKLAGVVMHITSLPGPYGIGDIGQEAQKFVRTLRSMGARVWQFLPLGPVGYGNSPYQPLSIYAGNEMLIALDPLLAEGLVTEEDVRSLRDLPSGFTDYEAVGKLKSVVLKTATNRFADVAGDSTTQAFNQFKSDHDQRWLHNYALFRVLKTRHNEQAWPDWDKKYVRRDQTSLDELSRSAEGEINHYKILQFWFHTQWGQLRELAASEGLVLLGDIPIYIGLDSADAWAEPELLEIDRDGRPVCVAGVPPDYFSADGQLWGNPLYDWPLHERTDYAWWKSRLGAALLQMDIIRLDHFRGFESYWAVPAGAATAREGEWRSGPADKLFHSVRASMGELPFIAEDLGLITDGVKEFLQRWDFPGMKVLQFMVNDEHFSAADIPWNSACYTGTHDNDTTLGWFANSHSEDSIDDEAKSRVLAHIDGEAETVHLDMIRFALNTEARLCMMPLQDVLGLGSEARMNTPGTTEDNWKWRLSSANSQTLETLGEQMRSLIVSSGRNS